MVHLFCLYGPPDMKHVVQMFWNVDEWNMTQPAEFLAFGAKCLWQESLYYQIIFVFDGGGWGEEWKWQNWIYCYEFYLHFMQQSCKEVHVIIKRCFLFVSVKETLVVKGCIQYRGTLLILDKGLAFLPCIIKYFYQSLLFILWIHISIVLCRGVNELKMQCSVVMVVSC